MDEKIKHIKSLIKIIGFSPEENSSGIFFKKYTIHKNYIIKIHLDKGEIDYGNQIILGDKTTSNFKASENFVVLECVNRLLEKGYSPENITLEKDYPLGHKTKGKLDILVTDKENKPYLMIECKTWGVEYDKAAKKTLSDGGQLLSYFQQDKSSKFLSLYTSKTENNTIFYKNAVIKVEEDFLQATNTREVFEKWNKNLKDNGIFEEWATPYNISIKALIKNSLIPLTKDDSSRIFNQFAEILRHNVVSDKPNAFNKFITLLLCKIVDEDKDPNKELAFQWYENDSNINLQKRLNDLYRDGMKNYLDKTVTDYSDQDVDNKFYSLNEAQREEIKKMMTELRLKKNNEFSFKEVFNDSSFEENSKVLREIVELLQPYQVRYNKKQQFLGDFFELLLNTSIKQEAGQYFTPVPIARFIISSIPLRKIILDKISNGEPEFLPYVIDYAVGSGHFITEAMDEIHNAIVDFNDSADFKPSVKKKLNSWAADLSFDWAYNFVYGIEKDYRLVKTAKVSCFLNGDGLARIFNADGLGNFETDIDYKDRLKTTSKTDIKDNQQFDVLIANPPYSVSSFKNTLINGDKSFELYNRLTEDSSEIECLFIERTKQLVKDGGYAGIILPNSILNNSGIHSDARDILLKYFKIIAITEFGSNTFMATGANTVTLFLQRRNNSDWQKVEYIVNNFFNNPADVTCNGIETPFSKYVAQAYKTISFNDYVSFVNKTPNERVKENELYKDYHKDFFNSTFVKNTIKKPAFKAKTETEQQAELDRMFYTDVFAKEREKLLFFILVYPQKTLLIKASPDSKNETEKEFLGYEFSNRRGHEGIKSYGAKTIQLGTKLYDENNLLNPEKVNSYIQAAFQGNEINIHESLKNHITQQNLVDLINFEKVIFEKNISLSIKKKVEIESKWEITKLGDLVELISGQSPLSEFYNTKREGIPFYQGKIEFGEDVLKPPTSWTTQTTKKSVKNDILMSVRAPVGPVNINPYEEICIGRGLSALRPVNDKCLHHYLYSYLKTNQENISGNKGVGFDSITREQILDIKIPLPPKNIQERIVKEIEAIEEKEKNKKEGIEKLEFQINSIIQNLKGDKTTLKNVIEINPSKSEIKNISEDTLVSFIEMASVSNDGYITKVALKKLQDVKTGFTYFKNEDVLFAKITPCMENGKGALVSSLSTEIGFGSTEFFVLRTSDKLSNKLLYHIIKQKSFRQLAEKNMTGTSGHRRVPKEFIENFEIKLPEITEQEKIVSEIEKIETKISILQKQADNIEEEKHAVLRNYL